MSVDYGFRNALGTFSLRQRGFFVRRKRLFGSVIKPFPWCDKAFPVGRVCPCGCVRHALLPGREVSMTVRDRVFCCQDNVFCVIERYFSMSHQCVG